jgi:hypothetical protein
MHIFISKTHRLILVTTCMATLAACQSAPTPDAMARTTTDLAPADLQLLCSNAVAKEAKADAAKTLPISSSRIDDRDYAVQVDAAGAKYNCTVGADGIVKSVVLVV